MKNNPVETMVGAAVIAVAAIFFFFVYSTTDFGRASGGNSIIALFDNVEGISVGSDVRMSGIKVGTVVRQELDPESFQARLVMAIDDAIALPDDSTAKVTSEGLLGAKFISVEVGGSETVLKDGDTLTFTQSALDIWALINQFMFDQKNK